MPSDVIVFAVDPGTTQSGWCHFDGAKVVDSGVSPNDELAQRIHVLGAYVAHGLMVPVRLAVERFEARGMPIGDDSIQTIIWTGRFLQAWHDPAAVALIPRSAVKLHLCGTPRAKDANIRQALIDAIGPRGTKKNPGPTYGVSSHAWAALAVAAVACAS